LYKIIFVNSNTYKSTGDSNDLSSNFVHLARLALAGRQQDVHLHVRRVAKRVRETDPRLSEALMALLREAPTRSSPLRRDAATAMPVDLDSRLQLVRIEEVKALDVEPVFERELCVGLEQLVAERRDKKRLEAAGLDPSRTALFVGRPGVGKSLAARWLARELGVPLLVLDLAAVMSSFLGRTGNNLRFVLDYAKSTPCILLLDELDAIAKRRDDSSEVGELKRLVTVLLQEIDDWPSTGLLIAATNHPDLLDPAVWRRFDVLLEFPMPGPEGAGVAVQRFLGPLAEKRPEWVRILAVVLRGLSYSDIEREILRIRRAFALSEDKGGSRFEAVLLSRASALSHEERAALAAELVASKAASQRRAYELTGISRDTIRKALLADSTRGEMRK